MRRLHRDGAIKLTLLWWAGLNLRVTLIAIPPLIPLLHRDLDLSPMLVGALNGLPVLLLAVAATGGSLLIARIGARRALVVGLCIVGVGSALRGVGPSLAILFSMTFLMSIGVAMMQPAMPVIARAWCPASIGRATAVYANGLLIGEVLSASLTIPLVLPIVGYSWAWALVLWSVPALFTALGCLVLTRDGPTTFADTPIHWRPDWRSGRIWRIGLILSGSGSLYFTTNAFIPDLLQIRGESGLIGAALTALNLGQMPASILIALFPSRLLLRRGPLIAVTITGGAALIGLLATSGVWVVISAAGIGFAAGFILIWTLALPPMIAPPDAVAPLSAGIFTIGYLCAFLSPLVGGAAWELSGVPSMGLIPAAVALAVLVTSVAGLSLVGSFPSPEQVQPARRPPHVASDHITPVK